MDALSLDHLVIHVGEREVLGPEVIKRGAGYADRIGDQQLNCRGPGADADPAQAHSRPVRVSSIRLLRRGIFGPETAHVS
ncbi:MAG: hypothetical protein QOD37_2326 [Gaiellales bacterium]|jgi:hypothetical protein|nr:hypothetical protein [Gaiellales bacterium]